MSHGKQFTLYTNVVGPNGWKVEIVFKELGLTYEPIFLNLSAGEHKAPAHTNLNPNGRIPTIIDHHNNDFTLWESCAILNYLVEKYDKERKISMEVFEDKMIQEQWLFFQGSGQGPYFGQCGFFKHIGGPTWRIPMVVERYQKEILRVFGVLESVLSKQEWLVGGKCTIADLAFIIWNQVAIDIFVADYQGFNFDKDFPATAKWHRALTSRPSAASVLKTRKAMLQG